MRDGDRNGRNDVRRVILVFGGNRLRLEILFRFVRHLLHRRGKDHPELLHLFRLVGKDEDRTVEFQERLADVLMARKEEDLPTRFGELAQHFGGGRGAVVVEVDQHVVEDQR